MELEINDIYRQYSKFVFNVALRMLNNRTEAEDVMQEVFIKLQKSIGSFKGNSNIKTYMYRMTVNQSIDLIRKHQSQVSRIEKSWNDDKHVNANNEDHLLLDSLLASLSEKQRAMILLYEIAGCTQSEIAESMGISTGTVKSGISRAIKKMATLARREANENALPGRQAVLLP